MPPTPTRGYIAPGRGGGHKSGNERDICDSQTIATMYLMLGEKLTRACPMQQNGINYKCYEVFLKL